MSTETNGGVQIMPWPGFSQKHHSHQGTNSTDPDRTWRGGNPNSGLRENNTLSRPFPGLLEHSCNLVTRVNTRATPGLRGYCPEAWDMLRVVGEKHLGIAQDFYGKFKDGIKFGKIEESRWFEEEE